MPLDTRQQNILHYTVLYKLMASLVETSPHIQNLRLEGDVDYVSHLGGGLNHECVYAFHTHWQTLLHLHTKLHILPLGVVLHCWRQGGSYLYCTFMRPNEDPPLAKPSVVQVWGEGREECHKVENGWYGTVFPSLISRDPFLCNLALDWDVNFKYFTMYVIMR